MYYALHIFLTFWLSKSAMTVLKWKRYHQLAQPIGSYYQGQKASAANLPASATSFCCRLLVIMYGWGCKLKQCWNPNLLLSCAFGTGRLLGSAKLLKWLQARSLHQGPFFKWTWLSSAQCKQESSGVIISLLSNCECYKIGLFRHFQHHSSPEGIQLLTSCFLCCFWDWLYWP